MVITNPERIELPMDERAIGDAVPNLEDDERLSVTQSPRSRTLLASLRRAACHTIIRSMATLHLMVGLPGSGKTTWARTLEEEHSALRLTVDEWHLRLFGNDVHDDSDETEWRRHDVRHTAIEALLWETASKVLALGVDVILDFGFWARSERDELRALAHALGAGFAIHYAEVSEELMLERIRARNAQRPAGTFHVPEAKLKEWAPLFEPPSPEEISR